MLHRILLLIGMLFALSACETTGGGEGESATRFGMIPSSMVDQIRLRQLDAVNALRAERGLSALAMSASLNAAADTHGRDMAVQQRAWNFGSDGSSPQTRAQEAGYQGRVVGENVGETFQGDFSMLQVWLNDEYARPIIFDRDATHFGFGWYQQSSGKIWWVQLLAIEGGRMVTAN